MYDIEKELRELKPKNHTPTNAFRHQTLAMLRNKTKKRRSPRKLVFSLAAAAVVMAFALVVVMLPTFNSVSYYTLDINPSIQFTVNSNDTVTDVSSANDDAVTLLDGSKLKGMPIKEALQSVIQLAYTQEYLAPGGHVLVAHFGSDEGISDLELKDIVDDITPGINVLLLNGEKSSYKEAHKQDMQAGIYLLKEQATNMGIAETDVDSLITLMCSEKDNEGKDRGNSGTKDNASGSVADVDKEAEHVPNSEAAQSKNEDKEDKPGKDDKQDKEDKPGKDDKKDKEDKPGKDDKEDKEDKPDNSNNGNGKNKFDDGFEDEDGDFDGDDDFEYEDDDYDDDDDDRDKDHDDVDNEEDNHEEDD